MPVLFGARVMQGLVGGLLVPVGQTIIGHVVDRARLGRIMSTIGIAIVVAPLLGTSLGATLVGHGGWRLLFWSPIPLCVLAITLGLPRLPPFATEGPTRLDWVSTLSVLTGLPVLLSTVATDVTAGDGLGRYYALMLGTLLIAVFVVRMWRARAPLLNLALLNEPRFACCAAIMAIGGAVSFGGQYLLPLFFVDVHGQSLTAAALLLTPQIAGSAIGLPLAGWITDRNGARMVLVAGGDAALYRFYPSKSAVMDAIAQEAMDDEAAIASCFIDAGGTAGERLKAMLRELHHRKRERFVGDREVHDLYRRILVERQDIITAYAERMTALIARLIEQAVERGEWRVDDAAKAACVIRDAVTVYVHPLFVAQAIEGGVPVEALLEATLSTLIRAFEAGIAYNSRAG